MGEKQSWKALTNGFSGKKLPTEFKKLFLRSLTTNTSEMNASGKITAFAAAEAELADLTSDASAIPSAANDATPTIKVNTAAGILAQSIYRSYRTTPIVSISSTPTIAMTTAESTNPAM